MGTQQSYNLRLKYSEFFSTRISILRYNTWLVVLSQSYTPSFADFSRRKHKFLTHRTGLDSSVKLRRSLHYARKKYLRYVQITSQLQKAPSYLF